MPRRMGLARRDHLWASQAATTMGVCRENGVKKLFARIGS